MAASSPPTRPRATGRGDKVVAKGMVLGHQALAWALVSPSPREEGVPASQRGGGRG
jgi:hypothetical protein